MIQTVILACGDSRRFQTYSPCPKQFLRFSTHPGSPSAQMWENTLSGLTIPSDVVVALRLDHSAFVERPTTRVNINAVWLGQTRGQADTLLQTLEMTSLYDREVLVVNCDQGFAPGLLDRLILAGRKQSLPAALTFTAPPEEALRWSYVDEHPYFTDAEEKRAISTHALAGAYYFPNRTHLVKNLIRLLNWSAANEPYISQVYGFMMGRKVSVEIRREDWYDWGTPETFTKFLGYT